MKRVLRMLLTLSVFSLLVVTTARADAVIDPIGDFLPTLDAGAPRAADLDVVSAITTLRGTNFLFSATMDGAIGITDEAFYVWGVDRGAGASTANFASLGLPAIVFDSVLIVQNEGTGIVNNLGGALFTLPAGSVTISGNTIEVLVPVSFLPSQGFTPDQYQWNLWPRWGGVPFGDAQISDFAPDSTNAEVQVVPEPATLFLIGTGLAGIGAAVRKRKNKED